MARLLIAALAAAALALPAATAPAQPRQGQARQAQRDWTRTVVATPEGGYRMGNPAARVKLVEYVSLTCPHCADFAAQSEARLFDYVRSGRVSVEYRHFVLNPHDLAAAVLSRCASPAATFAMSQELLRTQRQWLAAAGRMSAAERQRVQAMAPLEAVRHLVPVLGLDRIGARHGLTVAAQRSCVSRQANVDRLIDMAMAAEQLGVAGTPTFLINGRRVEPNSWTEIEALIRQAGG